MKVLHTIGSVRAEAGGPARSVQGLVAALDSLNGLDAWLLSFCPDDTPWLPGVNKFIAAKESGYKGALQAVELAVQKIKPDIIHIHGIWSLSSHAAVAIALKHGIPYIMVPRGMLEPWSLKTKRIKKLVAMWLYQRRDLKRASALHATAVSEADQFKKLGFTQFCVISPNGVNFPDEMPRCRQLGLGRKRILFLSRIHPKKGLLELVDAWYKLKNDPELEGLEDDWCIEIVGTDSDGYQRVIEKAVHDSDLGASFVFTGALNDTEKWKAYQRADLFVLPTHSENFGIVVAEALYAGVPVITTKGTPWAELLGKCENAKMRECCGSGNAGASLTNELARTGRSGWWIDIGVAPLAAAIKEAVLLDDEERQQMGEHGRQLIMNKYTWQAIVQNLKCAYEKI